MSKHSKRFSNITRKVNKDNQYELRQAVQLVKENATAKFDESVDIAIRLGVDPRKADQMVRGTVSLPHGIGKTVRVAVITREAKQQDARDAGADQVGFEDMLEKIKGGWTDIDVIIATPDVMGELGKLGKILGPRGLMPNPKSGTVTTDVGTAVREVFAQSHKQPKGSTSAVSLLAPQWGLGFRCWKQPSPALPTITNSFDYALPLPPCGD